MKTFCVGLVGNPNVGKTSLFNALTGSDAHVGNWHGVTVAPRRAKFVCDGICVEVVDLPGTYSLSAYSEEERVTTDFVKEGGCDLLVYVGNAGAYQRSLPLLIELATLGKNVFACWNMVDELHRRGGEIDFSLFYKDTGIPAIGVCANDKKSVKKLQSAIVSLLRNATAQTKGVSGQEVLQKAKEALVTKPKKPCFAPDKWLLNPLICLPLFVVGLFLAFTFTFASRSPGAMISDLLYRLFADGVGGWIQSAKIPRVLVGFLVDGLCVGVGSVLAFLPQIALLGFFLSMAEETGFLSRVAFLTDGLLQKIGLNGRAAFTVVMGFGCTATAAVTARGCENTAQRKKTVLLLPCLPCSARVPVFLTLINAYFARGKVWILMGIYLLSIVLVAAVGAILHRTVYRERVSFLMELAPYRIPNVKKAVKLLLENCKQFIIKVGLTVVVLLAALWFARSFTPDFRYLQDGVDGSILQILGNLLLPLFRPMGVTDWRIPVAALSGLAAKETVVGTLALLYPQGLTIGPATTAAFLTFTVWYSPCFAALSAMAKEVGKLPTVCSATAQTVGAFLLSYTVYVAYDCGGVVICVLTVLCGAMLVAVIYRKIKGKSGCDACPCVCGEKYARIQGATRGKPR